MKGTIVIRDIYGRTIDQFLLSNSEAVEIETNKFNEGVYFYSLYVDGEYVDTKKMTVIK